MSPVCPVCGSTLLIENHELAIVYRCLTGHFTRTRDFAHDTDTVDRIQKSA